MNACPRCGHNSLSVGKTPDCCEGHCCCYRTAVTGRCDHAVSEVCTVCCKCGYSGVKEPAS